MIKWKKDEVSKVCTSHTRGRNSYNLFCRNTERKSPLRRTRHRWKGTLKWILKEQGGSVWTGFVWLSIGTSGGHLNSHLLPREIVSVYRSTFRRYPCHKRLWNINTTAAYSSFKTVTRETYVTRWMHMGFDVFVMERLLCMNTSFVAGKSCNIFKKISRKSSVPHSGDCPVPFCY
jgi:hypothetical protein